MSETLLDLPPHNPMSRVCILLGNFIEWIRQAKTEHSRLNILDIQCPKVNPCRPYRCPHHALLDMGSNTVSGTRQKDKQMSTRNTRYMELSLQRNIERNKPSDVSTLHFTPSFLSGFVIDSHDKCIHIRDSIPNQTFLVHFILTWLHSKVLRTVCYPDFRRGQ